MVNISRNLLIIATIAVTASITIGTLTYSYVQQVVSAQNQNSSGSTIGNASAVPLRNFTGSVQVFPKLSQVIQSKANVGLSSAATSAQTTVGANSHVISAHLGVVNGFLVYVAHVVDANNNIHRVIVDAGNGKVLSTIQLPLAGGLIHREGRGIFGHYLGGSSGGIYGHSQGLLLGHHGLKGNIDPRM